MSRGILILIVTMVLQVDAFAQFVTSGGRRSLVTSSKTSDTVSLPAPERWSPPKREPQFKSFEEIFADAPEVPQVSEPERQQESERVSRPLMFAAVLASGCPPCDLLKRHVREGKFAGVDVVYTERRDASRGFPQVWYDLPGGGTRMFIGYTDGDRQQIQRDLLQSRPTTHKRPEPIRDSITGSVARFISFPDHPEWGTVDLKGWRHCVSSRCQMCNSVAPHAAAYAEWEQRQNRPVTFTPAKVDRAAFQGVTPIDVVFDTLDQMNLRQGDTLGDLGCGDGRFLVAAAQRGIPAIGFEIDPEKCEQARRNAVLAGVDHLVQVIEGDATQVDIRSHGITAVVAFQHEDLLRRLRKQFTDARVAVSVFHRVPGLPMENVGDVWIFRGSG